MIRKAIVVIFALTALILTATNICAVPLSPQLQAKLSASKLSEMQEALRQARAKGVEQPNPNPVKWNLEIESKADQPAIVILVEFSDNSSSTNQAHYDSMLFTQGVYPTGSLRDYYLENSYNKVDITGTVTIWLTMPQTYAYYVDGQHGFGSHPKNAQKLAEDAVIAADPYVDFSGFDADGNNYVDALFVVHAGPGAEVTGDPNDIWSHKWQTSSPVYVDGVYVWTYSMEPEDGNIGVFCHELGHVFGLPDLYDYGYDSQGVGYWTIMAAGSWGNDGKTPVHFDGWSKIQMGFVNPIVPDTNMMDVQIPQVETDSVIYKLWTDGLPGNEYFVVENRQKLMFDSYIPHSGLLIYHVDDYVWNNNSQWLPPCVAGKAHYKVAVEQADGNWDLEHNHNSGDWGDPFPGHYGVRSFYVGSQPSSEDYDCQDAQVGVTDISDSGDTMSCDIWVTGGGPSPPTFIRGDVETMSGSLVSDGKVGMGDGLAILGYYYGEVSLTCMDAGDVNDDGNVSMADGVMALGYYFGDLGYEPFPPFPVCGADPTPDGLDCQSHAFCMGGKIDTSRPAVSVKSAANQLVVGKPDLYDGLVSIPIDLTISESVIGLEFTVNYDASMLDLDKIVGGENYDFFVSNIGEGSVRISCVPDVEMKDLLEAGKHRVVELIFRADNLRKDIKLKLSKVEIYNSFVGLLPVKLIDGVVKAGALPERFELSQNYPNPFNSTTLIRYALPAVSGQQSAVSLEIYNILGEGVAMLVDGEAKAGVHRVSWKADNVASGVYLYTLKVGNFSATRKMVLLR